MKQLLLGLVLANSFAAPVWAQAEAAERAAQPQASAAATDEMADGEIRKVDKANAKITIKHGEIKHLDMPPMTMVFQVKGGGLLDKVKAGDKVRFRAEEQGGAYVVTEIRPSP